MASADPNSQRLVVRYQNLVRSIASGIRRKVPPYIDIEDLVAYGQIGLVEAARDFDPERGAVFSTYAYYRIRGAIYDGLSKLCWTSRSRYNRLRRAAAAGVDGAGDAVSTEGDSESRWGPNGNSQSHGIRSRELAVVFLAAMTQGESADGIELLEDSSTPSPVERAASDELVQKVQELLDALPRQAADLIHARYFEGMTLKEVGKRLGISKSWASRLHTRTLQQLAQSLKMEEITR